jgi:hypothetical protein
VARATPETSVASLSILNATPLPSATRGDTYTVVLQAQGGRTPYKWKRFSRTLPKGLKVKSTGLLTGTPKARATPGTYIFTVQAQDSSRPHAHVTKTVAHAFLIDQFGAAHDQAAA